MQGKRPRGVTIISILMIISGVASILIGLAILAGSISLSLVAQGSDVGALAGVLMGVGGLTIALGIASLVIAWGLINAKRWAWILTVIISIISIITSIAGIASGALFHIINLIIYGIILYYLYRPEVKSYFSRVKVSK
ncbi:MAG: hypothetical protein WB511_02805 [Nitrososphaeraceae archaeon]|jgi:hypothetical protein